MSPEDLEVKVNERRTRNDRSKWENETRASTPT